MRAFYFIALVAVIVLSLSPYWLPMPKEEVIALPGQVAAYETLPAKVKSIDPATCGDNISNMVQGGVYESLLTYHYLIRPSMLVPQLAEDFPQESADHLTYTFKLRKDARYRRNPCFGWNSNTRDHNTRVVKADDFVLAFKRIADYHVNTQLSLAFIADKIVGIKAFRARTKQYAKGDFSRYDLPLEGVQALDDHTLQFKLTRPWPQLLYAMALTCYAPIPREMIQYHLATRDDGNGGREDIPMRDRSVEIHKDIAAAVGSGAYYLEKFSDSEIIFRRNPDYHGATYPSIPDRSQLTAAQWESVEQDKAAGLYADAGKNCPFIDAIQYLITEEQNPMWGLFLAKLIDSAAIPQQMFHQVVSPDRALTDKWAKMGVRLYKDLDPSIYWLAFNMEDKVLGRSKALRQALQLSFDSERYIEVIWGGRGIRAVNYVPKDLESYAPDAHAAAGPSPYARFDLVAAKAKLEEARKELVAAKVIQEGQPLPAIAIEVGGQDELERRIAEFAQQQFRQIGVELKVELNDWPTLQKKVQNREFQMYSMGWGADYPDAENFLQLYYTPNIKRATNNTAYSNPVYDKLYEQAAVMPPSPERTEIYARMIRMLNEDCPTILMYQPIRMALAHSWVKNIKMHPIAYGMGKFRRIDGEERRREGGR